ncbi:TIGR02611 family protein [Modestobacter lapidis]|nr:TIGR02611 family protein [Modestobacter lapidis]
MAQHRATLDAGPRGRVVPIGWRRRLAGRPLVEQAYRACVGVVGGLVVAAGLVLVPLPGPGWLTVIAGLVVLASEFAWAERLLGFARRHVQRWTGWLGTQAPSTRLLVAVGTAVFVYGVVVIGLRIAGAPEWVPGWVPLWRS